MRKYLLLLGCCITIQLPAQTVQQRLEAGVQQMEADTQLLHASIGFLVVETKTGKTVYAHHAHTGLAPASTQKIFTSVAAFELLGKEYRYTTTIGYNKDNNYPTKGYFVLKPSGDPSFGSPRFTGTKALFILDTIAKAIKAKQITAVSGHYQLVDAPSDNNPVPGGWIWEDIGNYYGAAAHPFNWLENQYDIVFASGKTLGEKVTIKAIRPAGAVKTINNQVTSAAAGTGDNTIIYPTDAYGTTLVDGTIPVNETSFEVSGAIADPAAVFFQQLNQQLGEKQVTIADSFRINVPTTSSITETAGDFIELYKHYSPPLDSLNYWFLKKSINLYGEALLKTMAFRGKNMATTQKGTATLINFWEAHGIEKSALHIGDGSGLSPQNRVTADAEVKALQFAFTRPWFSSFYNALPVYNGMRMKSGAIGGARAYAGYHTSKDGTAYSFSIIVNNYDGDALTVVKKIYRLLDNLK